MTEKINLARIAVILLFAITFTLVGWTAPALYASSAPADDIIDVHSYEAQDTTINSDTHYVCFDRTVSQGTSANVVTELYLLNQNGERIEVARDSTQTYFQEGRSKVIIPRELPDNLQQGEYRYVVVSDVDMVNGRITRTISFESQPFTVTDGPAINPERPTNC